MYTDQPHVFQLLFSNKSTSRAIKNMAAFVRDVTHSPAAEEQHKNDKTKKSYVTDDPITIYNVSPQGKMKDITKEKIDNFSVDKWKDWESRLSHSSIKKRMDDVTIAYTKCLEEENNNNTDTKKEH
jgi:hypothetical protein